MPTQQELHSLIAQFRLMAEIVSTDPQLERADLRRVLRFLTKVMQIVDQAFQDVYATLVDFKDITLADLSPSGLAQLRKDLDLLLARDRYRDAEQICSRLHALSDQFRTEIEPLLAGISSSVGWGQMFQLLDEYEGRIIWLVRNTIGELGEMLQVTPDENSALLIRQAARTRSEEIRAALNDLQALKDRILGLSGQAGMMELTEPDSDDHRPSVTFDLSDRSVNQGPRIAARDITVPGQFAMGSHNTQTMSTTTSSGLSVQDALALIDQLKASLQAQPLPDPTKERAVRQVEEAKAEANEKEPDKDYIATTLKKVTDTLKQGGLLVTAGSALGQQLVPLAQWAGKTATWLGIG